MPRLAFAVLTVVVLSLAIPVLAQAPPEIAPADAAAAPESLTSTANGTIYFGSMGKGTVYRAAAGATKADPWIDGAANQLTFVLGVLADEKAGTLWVCSNRTEPRDGVPATGQVALHACDLKTGTPKGTYPFPNGGLCNDIAVAADGSAYLSDTTLNRILRLKPGAAALDVWAADPLLAGIDGLSFLADGVLYANSYTTNKFVRVPVKADGTAGPVAEVQSSVPFVHPDGLRTVGPNTLLQAEGQGKLTEITIDGGQARVRVLKEGLKDATAVTLVGADAVVLFETRAAVPVKYH